MRMSNHLHNFRLSSHVSSDIFVLMRSFLVYDFNCNLSQARKNKKKLSEKPEILLDIKGFTSSSKSLRGLPNCD